MVTCSKAFFSARGLSMALILPWAQSATAEVVQTIQSTLVQSAGLETACRNGQQEGVALN